MDVLDRWAESFAEFVGRFAGLFGRSEPREQMAKYVRGLLAPLDRKNGWQLAEAVGDACPDRMQRLLYRAHWDADAARDVVRGYVAEQLGEAEAIGIVDETGFLKKGTRSVGVKRQYSGTAGRTENCQVGTFLAYATSRGQTLLDRRRYLPAEWCADAERRGRAQVPESVTFQAKPQQALAMLQAAWEAGVPMRWVTGDAVYGDAAYLRAAIHAAGRWYVLGVASPTPVWTERPVPAVPAPAWVTVAAAVAALPAGAWQRLSVPGEKGAITYDWARVRVVARVDGRPGRPVWVLARRSVADPTTVKYFLSNAPGTQRLPTLARVASTRFAVEQCFEEAKGQNGLDEYACRLWTSWHRHITLAMMAHAWLTVVRADDSDAVPLPDAAGEEQKGGGASVGAPDRARSATLVSAGRAAA